MGLLVALCSCAVPQSADLQDFRFSGRPIHPAMIRELLTPLEDGLPPVSALDVEGFMSGNRAAPDVVEKGGEIQYCDDCDSFAYRHLGSTPSGTHVLLTSIWGGFSGVFNDLLFVRFETDSVFEEGERRDRLVLKRVGSFTLGDRDDGNVEFLGDSLFVGRSRYRPQDAILRLD